MLRWFHRLMPKEERFFEMFAQHSHAVVAGAVALRAMLEGGDAISAQLSDGDGSRAGRRQRHARGSDRGAADLHHAVRSRQHSRPDHVDGQFHRPDAEDRQIHPAVRRDRIHAGDEGHGGHHSEMRRTGAGGRPAAQIDRRRGRPHQRSHRADIGARRQGRRDARQGPARSLTAPTSPAGTGSTSSSATRFTTISRRWSIASTTSPT